MKFAHTKQDERDDLLWLLCAACVDDEIIYSYNCAIFIFLYAQASYFSLNIQYGQYTIEDQYLRGSSWSLFDAKFEKREFTKLLMAL